MGVLWIGLSLIGLLLLSPQRVAGGFDWDIGNGIGLAAFAALCYLAVSSGRGRGLASHQRIAWFAAAGVALHAGYFLIKDATVFNYLKPAAPFYMWCGVVGLVLALSIALAALPGYRRMLFRRPAWFGPVHWSLSTICLLASGVHIAGSGLYLNNTLQQGLFGLLLAGLIMIPWLRQPAGLLITSSEAGWIRISLVLVGLSVLFAASRQL